MPRGHRVEGDYVGTNGTYAIGGKFSLRSAQLLTSNNLWGKDLIQSGLVLDLDSNNTASYSGTGNTWTDTASGLTFNAGGTTTPYQTLGTGKGFAFNNSGYWASAGNESLVDMGGDTTLIMWLYGASQSTRRGIFEKAGTSYTSYQQEIACTWEPDNTISYYSRYSPEYDYSPSNPAQTSGWFMWAIKMSTGRTSAARTGFYSINGASWTSNYNSRSNTALISSGQIRIGTGYTGGAIISGGVGRVAVYNRMLSDAEIAQTYSKTRIKYGV